jgi:hypothetical protein
MALQTALAEINNALKVTLPREVNIRDRWHEFSMEKSNTQSAREAAFKFSQELREILKRHFQKS